MSQVEGWVGINEVASYLHVTKQSIFRWVRDRNLPVHRAGRLLRFKLSEVDEWVKAGNGSTNKPESKANSVPAQEAPAPSAVPTKEVKDSDQEPIVKKKPGRAKKAN